MNRLAAVARKHGAPSACKAIIGTMYGFNAMEVQEAFVKICEQAQAFLAQPAQLAVGLNLVAGQNLNYFQVCGVSGKNRARMTHSALCSLDMPRPLLSTGQVKKPYFILNRPSLISNIVSRRMKPGIVPTSAIADRQTSCGHGRHGTKPSCFGSKASSMMRLARQIKHTAAFQSR